MSSILYVEVKEKADDTLTLLLVEIQCGFVFGESATLALGLLLESWENMMRGRVEDAVQAGRRGGFYCPFSAEEARARAERSVIRGVAEGARASEDSPLRDIEFFFDETFIAENAPRYICSTEVMETRHLEGLHGARPDQRHYFAPHGECLFRIRVADPHWLDHLEPGVCWDTTVYPF
jgi:hypothetical protein